MLQLILVPMPCDLLVSNIVEQEGKETQFNKSSLVRVPIRLGQDVLYSW
jgi:hypothetical protein